MTARLPAGAPASAGGRFAAQERPEPHVALSAGRAPTDPAEALSLAADYCASVGGARAGTCYPASWTIRDTFGWPVEGGVRDGVTHYWNRMPDGRIFDATAAQFGDDGPQVLAADDARYEARDRIADGPLR